MMVVRGTILVFFFQRRRGRRRMRGVVKSISETPYTSFDNVLAKIARSIKKSCTPKLIYTIA